MTLLTVSGLSAGYSKLPVLHGIDIALAKNEVVALVGPNGAGKSSLLKAIFQILRPLSGSVVFDGVDLSGTPTSALAKQGMAYVPQGGNTFPSLTVEENLKVALAAVGGQSTNAGLERAFDRFPMLAKRRTQSASTLSGGERQMLALAGAMAAEPQFLALDEPTTGLAPTIVQDLIGKITENRRSGVGILWVIEENPTEILPHCDRVYVMGGGKVTHQMAAAEILNEQTLQEIFFGTKEADLT